MENQTSFWEWLLSIDGITFIIAVLGFAMSVYNFIVNIIQNTVRLKVEFAHVFRFKNRDRCVEVINVKIYNKSKIPVVVSRLSVHNRTGKYSFGSYRRELLDVRGHHNNEITYRNRWMSDLLPVKIEGNDCVNLLLIADEEGCIVELSEKDKVIIHTAKRNIRKNMKIIRLSDSKLLSQCREPSC